MKPLSLLILHFSYDALTEKLCSILEQDKDIRFELCDLDVQRAGRLATIEASTSRHNILVIVIGTDHRSKVEKLLGELSQKGIGKPILLCAGKLSPENLAGLAKLDISDFAIAPLAAEDILLRLRLMSEKKSLKAEIIAKAKEKFGLQKIIGKSPIFLSEINKLPKIASCDASVLITGETGTGKEIVARAIHYLSSRAGKPYVPVNCGAIPNELVENELFGHERGSFTGALYAQKGLIPEANGGTLFLDEIDSLTLSSQVKLLRFLQDKEYRPLGGVKVRRSDVRIVAASNHNLEELVEKEKLRPDLYYRLNVMQITLPALRERTEDICRLARHFLRKYATEFMKPADAFEPVALQMLQSYYWPGNVRELENVVERAVLLCENGVIEASDIRLPDSKIEKLGDSFRTAKEKVVARFEESYIQKILEAYHGNITQAAKAAGKNRRAFFELIRKYRLNADRFRPGTGRM